MSVFAMIIWFAALCQVMLYLTRKIHQRRDFRETTREVNRRRREQEQRDFVNSVMGRDYTLEHVPGRVTPEVVVACGHTDSVPVDSIVTGEILTWWCFSCESNFDGPPFEKPVTSMGSVSTVKRDNGPEAIEAHRAYRRRDGSRASYADEATLWDEVEREAEQDQIRAEFLETTGLPLYHRP